MNTPNRQIPESHYLDQLHVLQDLSERAHQSEAGLQRTFLSLQSTLLAVLVALRPTTPLSTGLLVLYLLALVLLLLGSLSSLWTLYDLSTLPKRSQAAFHDEIQSAVNEGRRVRPIFGRESWGEKYLPRLSASFLVGALLSLIAFAGRSLVS